MKDPDVAWKKRIEEQAQGMLEIDRLRFFVREAREAKSLKIRGERRYDFLRPRILELYSELDLRELFASPQTFSWLEDVLTLSNTEEAEQFVSLVYDEFGEELAKRAIQTRIRVDYAINPEILELLEERPDCKRRICQELEKNPRLQIRPATTRARKGK